MKYEKEFKAYFSKVQIFTFRDAKRFLKKMGASDSYIKLFMHIQTRRHQLLRVSKGCYTFMKNDAIVGFAFSPFYYGMEHALTIHRLWDQTTNPVIITTKKARPGVRTAIGIPVIVRRISKHMFFGVVYLEYGGIFVPVSDVEKTLMDFIHFKVGIGEEYMLRMLDNCDVPKLRKYSKAFSKIERRSLEKILARSHRNQKYL